MKKKIRKKHRYGVKQPSGCKTLYEATPPTNYFVYARLSATATSTNYSPNAYNHYGRSQTIFTSGYKSRHEPAENLSQPAKTTSIWKRIVSLWGRTT